MIFDPLPLAGAFVVEPERFPDERGFFARTFCREEFREHGVDPEVVQCNVSFNRRRGTLRGMHWQAAPHEEGKLVRVTRGAIWDAIVDLRPGSGTRLDWYAVELDAESRRALWVPKGFAHGFLTLDDETEVFYQMSAAYHPESARGARWNDPAFGIEWPAEPEVIGERDRAYPDFEDSAAAGGGA